MLPKYHFDDKYEGDSDGFTFDLSAWLNDDAISTAQATVTPSDATVLAVVTSGSQLCVWVSGGTAGQTYTIEVHVVTTGVGGAPSRDCRIRGDFNVVA